jgi:hypothetical protein
MVVEMDRRLRRRSSNIFLTLNRMLERPKGGISFGPLALRALVQAPVRLQ